MRPSHNNCGFTLSELLIALVILGVIATFTIPKVLQSQASGEWKAKAKETVSMVSGALQVYKQNNTVDVNTSLLHLTPYMNYVRLDTTSNVDNDPGTGGTASCGGGGLCLQLHNGSILGLNPTTLGNTQATSALLFGVDPDGKATGNADTVIFFILGNGRIVTAGQAESAIYYDGSSATSFGMTDPSWFSWN